MKISYFMTAVFMIHDVCSLMRGADEKEASPFHRRSLPLSSFISRDADARDWRLCNCIEKVQRLGG